MNAPSELISISNANGVRNQEFPVTKRSALTAARRTRAAGLSSHEPLAPCTTVRAQIREYIKSLTPDQARAFLRSADETTAAAVLEAPAFLSGLSPETHGNFREQRLRALHGEKLKSLDAGAAATKLVARTLDVARRSTRTRIAPFLPPVEPEQKTTAEPWVS